MGAVPSRLAPASDGTWRCETIAPAVSTGEAGTLKGQPGCETAASGSAANATVSPLATTLAGGSTYTLDNGLLRVVIDDQGHVVSLRDLAGGRELVPSGEVFGALELFRDQPVRWDAWDVDRHVLELSADFDTKRPVVTIHPVVGSDGAQVTSRVTVDRTRGDSTFRVEFHLPDGAADLEITVDVDWHEREHLLKLALPLDLHTRTARYETQYGYVERSVTANTSWDEAQYEVSQHRFVHLEEPGCGIGVVNDSSYGLDVRSIAGGTVVRPSLLRGARFPDPGSDLGRHRMRFAVVVGNLPATIDAAYALNAPILDLPALEPLLQLELEEGTAAVDWITLAEDGSGDVIARIAELAGGRARGRLLVAPDLTNAEVVETDLLERPVGPTDPDLADAPPRGLEHDGPVRDAHLALRPFQLLTLRLRRLPDHT